MEKEIKFERTIQFIEKSMGEGAHLKIPLKYLDPALTYLLSPRDVSLEVVGKIFSLSKESVRFARKKTLTDLYNNANEQTIAEFPIVELELNKPYRKKNERVVFSKEPKSNPITLIDELKKAKTYQEKQELISLVTRKLYQENVKGDNPFFLPVMTLVRKTGFHVRKLDDHALFREAIKASNIAIGKVSFKPDKTRKIYTYYFILTSDRKEARKALLKNESLKYLLENPVSQIAGPAQKQLPSTTQLRKTKDYKSIYALLNELRIKNIPMTEQYAMLLESPHLLPVPIFCHENRYKFPIEGDGALMDYAKAKLGVD